MDDQDIRVTLRYMLLVLLLVVVACASDDSEPRRSATPSPTRAASEFINGGPCPLDEERRLHPKAGCVTTATGDAGTLSVYAIVGRGRIPRSWRINLARTNGKEIDQELDAGNRFSYPRAIAAIDVNADGGEEWLIKNTDLASHGTNWQRLELFTLQRNRLVPVMLDDEPLWVNVGGPSRLGEGARCDGARFVLLRSWAIDRQNTRWAYSERDFRIVGSEATLLDRREGKYRVTDYNDRKIDPYYQVECGSFLYP